MNRRFKRTSTRINTTHTQTFYYLSLATVTIFKRSYLPGLKYINTTADLLMPNQRGTFSPLSPKESDRQFLIKFRRRILRSPSPPIAILAW
jgi:hypothetical protein